MTAMSIGSAGMSVQRARMRVIAENLANQHTTGPSGPYQRKEVLLKSVPITEFQTEFDNALDGALSPSEFGTIESVAIDGIVEDNSEPILRYDPNHPQADADGYVALPNISIIREMTDMIEATRSYEANLAVVRSTRQMIQSVLDLLT